MTINEKTTTTFTATTLPGAPPRETRAEAEADEARGIELAAYLAVLPTLTVEQWERVAVRDVARDEAWFAARDAAWDVARFEQWDAACDAAQNAACDAAQNAACDAERVAARAALAIIVRDRITPDQFDTLTAPMRAAGVNFDGPTNHTNGEWDAERPQSRLKNPCERTPEFESMEQELYRHQPVLSMTDGSIAGCHCMDRVFYKRTEDWGTHLAEVFHALGSGDPS